MHKPDRPIKSFLAPLRTLMRSIRLLYHRVELGRKLSYGNNVFFGRRCSMFPPQRLAIGNDVAIGAGFHLETNLEIGNEVLISSHVSIVGNDHRFDDPNRSIFYAGRLPPSSVVIEGDNLIGHRVIIVGNVRIGRGCIVGAGSVVTKDLPPNSICYGIPARLRKPRFLAAP